MILSFSSHCRCWLEKVGRKLLLWRSRPSIMIATTGSGSGEIDPRQPESPHPIAHGSFGDVWKCTYTASDRRSLEVAVKSIRIDVVMDDSRARLTERLLADFHARNQLHHENLLSPLGFSHEFGLLPAIVYPWMHNGSLTIYLERHSTELTKEQKLRIVSCFSEALVHHVHSKGIVHGNLTANNILIDSDHNAHVAYDGILPWAVPKLYGEPEDEKSLTPQPASDIHSLECITHQVMNA
ncbi:kinase-like domain-containing protein [Suillus subalutaceus]|uniref:kinase-like domain-containing protein n=1 Tax=Suillus subalutaceus TaxID=48586 RepID=UPI001B860FBA|nr:kinase-like domain-containing protein [Suillus subalutaceus]KAG1856335.1 kinase-like domain-containing protein [Suillus subalutaceus]